MDKDRIIYLHQRLVNGDATAEELKEFREALKFPVTEALLNAIADGHWENLTPEELDDMAPGTSDKIFSNIIATKQDKKRLYKKWIAVTAAVFVLFAFGLKLYRQMDNSKPEVEQRQDLAMIKPGENKAYLVLENGKRVMLNDSSSAFLETGKHGRAKTVNGLLMYDAAKPGDEAPQYHIVETPKGGQYQIRLADGTRVWLNAASSLRYPNHFEGKERKVELMGEAYFEVAKDEAHAFVVKTDKQLVQVLGTHFNINAYQDEQQEKSTLLEGSIRVTNLESGFSRVLKPGEQSRNVHQALAIEPVNVEEVVAWKNGYFRFNNQDIRMIMRQISRWYNVEVAYGKDVTHEQFNGAITRFSDIRDVLRIMERSKVVHFKMEERRIVVEK